MELTTVKDLSCECVDYKSRNYYFDWSWFDADGQRGVDKSWEFWEACACEKCGFVFVNGLGPEGESSHEGCDGTVATAEGPMMNYFYAIPSGGSFGTPDTDYAARQIVDLPLCIVRVGEEYGLALTGGGKDLSWAICEAYMRLGYLPPLHFAADLPQDRELTAHTRWVLDGAEASAFWISSRAKGALSKIEALRLALAVRSMPERKMVRRPPSKRPPARSRKA